MSGAWESLSTGLRHQPRDWLPARSCQEDAGQTVRMVQAAALRAAQLRSDSQPLQLLLPDDHQLQLHGLGHRLLLVGPQLRLSLQFARQPSGVSPHWYGRLVLDRRSYAGYAHPLLLEGMLVLLAGSR